MKDLEIIRNVQSGKKNYFGKLYEKYIDEIYKFIYLKTTDKEISEDLVSDTFFSALQNISQFNIEDKNANFRAWVYKIAYNKVINYYKTCDREIGICDFLEIPFDENFTDNIYNKDKLRDIFEYLKTLSENERNIIICRIWYDLSFKEISEILGLSLDNCKKISSRTIKKISANFLSILFIFLIF